jgi:hypothetical protein
VDTAADLTARLKTAGSVARFEQGIDVLTVNNRFAISLRLARCWRTSVRKPIWTINRRAVMADGHIIAIRLGEGNKSVLDYFLLPTKAMTGSKIRFMEAGLHRFDGCRFRIPLNSQRQSPIKLLTACGQAKQGNLSWLDALWRRHLLVLAQRSDQVLDAVLTIVDRQNLPFARKAGIKVEGVRVGGFDGDPDPSEPPRPIPSAGQSGQSGASGRAWQGL